MKNAMYFLLFEFYMNRVFLVDNRTLKLAVYRKFHVNVGERAQIVKQRRTHGYLCSRDPNYDAVIFLLI